MPTRLPIRIRFCKMKPISSTIVGRLVEIMATKVSLPNTRSLFGGKNAEKRSCPLKLISLLRRICLSLMIMMMVCYPLDFWMVGSIPTKGNLPKTRRLFGRMNTEKKSCLLKPISLLKKNRNSLLKTTFRTMVFRTVGSLPAKVSLS